MKKALTVLAAVLLLAALFVGCGLESQLTGTSWECSETEDIEGVSVSVKMTVTFEEKGVFNAVTVVTCSEYPMMNSTVPISGNWSADGDELTITVEGESTTNVCKIDGDKATFTIGEELMTFTKVK